MSNMLTASLEVKAASIAGDYFPGDIEHRERAELFRDISNAMWSAYTEGSNTFTDLLKAAKRLAHIPCEMHGNIHCTMLPRDSGQKMCPFCELRAAIAKAEGRQ